MVRISTPPAASCGSAQSRNGAIVTNCFSFSAELWEWQSNGGTAWIFVTLPTDIADAVDDLVAQPGGFGSVKVNVQIGETKWSTSLFPDKSSGSFVLPLKRSVRDAEKIDVGDTTDVTIEMVHAAERGA